MSKHAAKPRSVERESVWLACIRGIAGLFGLSLLVNALGGMIWPAFDASVWMVDLRTLPRAAALVFGALTGAIMLAWAIRAQAGRSLRAATSAACTMVAAVALTDTVRYHRLLAAGELHSGAWLAWSAVVALAVAIVFVASTLHKNRPATPRRLVSLTSACFAGGIFLLAQMTLFGMTDYRRPADAILVFGARVYADGRPSLAAADRVRTGVELYKSGLASRLILSGGPGDGEVHEAEGMAAYAEALGVPRSDIVLDYNGLNTESSIRNARRLMGDGSRVLVVSHFYHMARIKLCSERTGLLSYTVPARQERPLARTPYYMAREAAALVAYYFRRPAP